MEKIEKRKIQSFTDLGAWREGHQLVLTVYELTRTFPKEELFGIVSQMRRAAVSITSNIAEGFGRSSFREKVQFYSIARGSAMELQNQLIISKDIGYLSVEEFKKSEEQSTLVHKILTGLIRSSKNFPMILIFFILFSIFSLPSSASAAITRPGNALGLAAYWTMNEGTGTLLADGSGNKSFATLAGGTSWVNGRLGKAVSFDGVSGSAASSAVNLSDTSVVTLSFWLKVDSYSSDDKLAFEYTNNYNSKNGFFVDPNASGVGGCASNKFSVSMSKSNNTFWEDCFTRPSAGAWHHYVVVFNRSTPANTVYVDGVAQSLSTVLHNSSAMGNFDNSTLYFMSRGLSSLNTAGSLDEVRVYKRALSAAEAGAQYRVGYAKMSAPTTSGLLGYWSFEDGTSTIVSDMSGNGLHASVANIAAPSTQSSGWATGKFGKAMNFDRQNDMVSVASTSRVDNLQAMTISAWVFPRDDTGELTVGRIAFKRGISSDSGWTFGFFSSNLGLGFTADFDGASDLQRTTAQDLMQLNKWQHVVLTWDGSTNASNVHIYVNGVEAGYLTTTNGAGNRVDDSVGKLIIGNNLPTTTTWNGLIDEFRLYNRVLSAPEIQALFAGPQRTPINSSQNDILRNGLVGMWSFNGVDMTSTVAYDSSGNSRHGTLNLSPKKVPGKIGQALEFNPNIENLVTMGAQDALFPEGQPVTISAWIKPRTEGANNICRIVDRGVTSAGPLFGCTSFGGFRFQATGSANIQVSSATNILLFNQWQHVAMTWDGSTNASGVHLYQNGEETAYSVQTNGSSLTNNSATSFAIGGSVTTAARTFDGAIDEVRVYNRVLSSSEIKLLYRLGQ
jgi:four helix bundle protein